MKIAIYSGEIPSTTFIEYLVKGVAAAGHEVYLFGKKRKTVGYDDPRIHQYPSPESIKKMLPFYWKYVLKALFSKPSALKRFNKVYNEKGISWKRKVIKGAQWLPIMLNEPDVFHIQWSRFLAENPELFDLIDSKVVVSFRGAQVNYTPVVEPEVGEMYQKLFPRVHAFHAVSHTIAKVGTQYGSDLSKTRVIKPAIDDQLLERGATKRFQTKKDKKLNILSIGRFHWKKGYMYALDALKLLKDQGVDFHYTIVAKSDPEEYIFQILDMGLENHVTIMGALSHEEVLKRVYEADIFFLPSVEEGIANVVLEAMALGTTVVTTDAGGIDEVIEDGVNGFIVKVRDTNGLAKSIQKAILLSPAEQEAQRDAAFDTLKKEHVQSLQFSKFKAFYEEIAKQN